MIFNADFTVVVRWKYPIYCRDQYCMKPSNNLELLPLNRQKRQTSFSYKKADPPPKKIKKINLKASLPYTRRINSRQSCKHESLLKVSYNTRAIVNNDIVNYSLVKSSISYQLFECETYDPTYEDQYEIQHCAIIHEIVSQVFLKNTHKSFQKTIINQQI